MSVQSEPSAFDTLPGVPLAVRDIAATLAGMWSVERVEGVQPPSEFRASQMNLVILMGCEVSGQEAQGVFDAAITFAQKYPCRVLVLCPESSMALGEPMRAKLYSQCFIGETHREMCCCEAIVLGFSRDESHFLEDQVSVFLESDLPTYLWLHRVPSRVLAERHLSFMKSCRRVIFDASVEDEGYAGFVWPVPAAVSDLSRARLLPVRQCLGQCLSAHHPKVLVNFLERVVVHHEPALSGEGKNLLEWMRTCFEEISRRTGKTYPIEYLREPLPAEASSCLAVEWHYTKGRHFLWTHCAKTQAARVQAEFGYGPMDYPMRVRSLAPHEALAEAMFF